MSPRPTRGRIAARALSLALGTSLVLGGCGLLDGGGADEPSPAPTEATTVERVYDSQFTRDGTFQSHIGVKGAPDIDFVYTLYPTKSTPRTNEWYPRGKKYFSFTFQGYDLAQGLRDPFRTKRKIYLDRITVTSRTITSGGGKTERPYELDAVAREITFDPEPLSTKYGMLITSPKGAFELRNQAIEGTSLDTRGIDLMFTATVWVESRAGSGDFRRYEVEQTVPIAIFESEEKTEAAKIPINAN